MATENPTNGLESSCASVNLGGEVTKGLSKEKQSEQRIPRHFRSSSNA